MDQRDPPAREQQGNLPRITRATQTDDGSWRRVRAWYPHWFRLWHVADNEHGNRTILYLWNPQNYDVFIVQVIDIQFGRDDSRWQ